MRAEIVESLARKGITHPFPIQSMSLPIAMAGTDMIGQARTGTGKTLAFGIAVLEQAVVPTDPGYADLKYPGKPQALIMTPTRELALQIAGDLEDASAVRHARILTVYGGVGYEPQLEALERGVDVVVGTPGRLLDLANRRSLDLSHVKVLVLDEADEMLDLGFLPDVERLIARTPASRQTLLFSATMPSAIVGLSRSHLTQPVNIRAEAHDAEMTVPNTTQFVYQAHDLDKPEIVARIIQADHAGKVMIFTRTKRAAQRLADDLEERGFSATSIHGDLSQVLREKALAKFREDRVKVLVATDVAARGLDVERISHVFNYDIPYDTESYVHRIGRTGRAGRQGDAILFVTPRERGMLRAIERATRQPIEVMDLPSVEIVNDRRVARFRDRIVAALGAGDLGVYRSIIEQVEREHDVPAIEIAAALARLAQGDKPLLLDPPARVERREAETAARPGRPDRSTREARGQREPGHGESAVPPREGDGERRPRPPREFERSAPAHRDPEPGMETFRVEVGHAHGVKPGNIVGAIANEAELDSKHIGRISIRDDHSLIDLPEGMPPEILAHLKKVWVAGQRLRISRLAAHAGGDTAAPRRHDAAPKGPRPPRAGGAPKPGFDGPRPPRKPHRKGGSAPK